VQVSFRVRNVGGRTGTETAQVYLELPASTGEPPKWLVGYAQVTLRPDRSAKVRVTIDPAAPTHPLGYFDAASHRWRVAPGTYRVYVGTSERDTPLTATFAVSSH
jgi:beta-glucosidase